VPIGCRWPEDVHRDEPAPSPERGHDGVHREAPTTTAAAAGVPDLVTRPSPRSPAASGSARTAAGAADAQASASEGADFAAPSEISRRPSCRRSASEVTSSELDLVNASTPAASVPKPITSTAVTNTK